MRCILACLIAAHLSVATAAAIEPILLPWTERKPFQYVDESGQLTGILHTLGERIFSGAKLERRWEEIPANRIINMLERDEVRLCLVGWFKTPEREKIARISLPIYRDRPLHGVVPSDSRIAPETTLEAIFADTRLNFVLKQGYSYGTRVDQLIQARKGEGIERVVVDNEKILAMVRAKRADITLLPEEEIDYRETQDPSFTRNFKRIHLADLPIGNSRHVICSRQVSDADMMAIDASIKATVRVK